MPARLYAAAEARAILDALTQPCAFCEGGSLICPNCGHLDDDDEEWCSWDHFCGRRVWCDQCSATGRVPSERGAENLRAAAPDLAASVIVHANDAAALRAAVHKYLAAIDEITHGADPHARVVAAEAALRALVATPASTSEH